MYIMGNIPGWLPRDFQAKNMPNHYELYKSRDFIFYVDTFSFVLGTVLGLTLIMIDNLICSNSENNEHNILILPGTMCI